MKRVNILLYLGAFFTLVGMFTFLGYKYGVIKTQAREKLDEGQTLLLNPSEVSWHKSLEILTPVASGNIGTPEEHAEALYLVGGIYEKLNMPEIAKKKYMQALKQIRPDEVSWKEKLSFKIAKTKIMTLYKDEALIRLLLLAKDIQDKGLLSEVYTELARLYLTVRKKREAMISLNVALRENPNNREAIQLLSKLKGNFKQGNHHQSECVITEANLNNCSVPGVNQANKLQREKNKALSGKDFLKVAFGYYGQYDYHRAIQYFRKIIHCCKDTPEEEIAWFYTGSAYALLNKARKAIEAHKKVLSNTISARDQLSMIKIGQLYFQRGDFLQAIQYFKMSQQRYPDGKYLDIAKEWRYEAEQSQGDKEKYNG